MRGTNTRIIIWLQKHARLWEACTTAFKCAYYVDVPEKIEVTSLVSCFLVAEFLFWLFYDNVFTVIALP